MFKILDLHVLKIRGLRAGIYPKGGYSGHSPSGNIGGKTVPHNYRAFAVKVRYGGETGVEKSDVRFFKPDLFGKKGLFKENFYSGVFETPPLYLLGAV